MRRAVAGRLLVAALSLSLAVVGCASAKTARYEKSGVSAQQRDADSNACVQESLAGREGGKGGGFFVRVDRDAYARCMTARGYTPSTAP